MKESGKKRKIGLPARILLALALGIAVGLVCYFAGWSAFTVRYLKPFGTIFINLLKFIVVPVVLLSMINGVTSMGNMKKVGSVGWKALAYFLVTTALACVIGLAVADAFRHMNIFPVLLPAGDAVWTGGTSLNFMDTLVGIFPTNLWQAFSEANMLQVIVIALLIGGGILAAGKKGERCRKLAESAYAVTEKIMDFILALSPIGVFTMIAWVVAAQGAELLGSLALVILCAYVAYVLHCVLVYSISVKACAGMSPIRFFRDAAAAMIFAFTSASSNAALPISRECADKLGADGRISAFVLPLGCTVNMDGTAIYQCVATVFLAACCGIHLTVEQLITVVLTVTVASIGTAGVSGAGTIMLAMVLETMNIPVDMIMILYGVDRLFDMGRTAVNITGDISCAVCVSKWESRRKAAPPQKDGE